MKKIIKRAKDPVPPFFKTLRGIGLALTAVSTALLTAPVVLPAAIITAAGYVAVGGAITTAVSQLTVRNDK